MTKLLDTIETSREPDGTVLLAVPRRDVPLVQLAVSCSGGLLLQPAACPGLASLTAALMREGPNGFTPSQWHRTVEDLALSMGSRASGDVWVASAGCLSEDLGTASDLFARMVTDPAMPRTEWRAAVKTQRASAREHWAQPFYVAHMLSAAQSLGRGHPNAAEPCESDLSRCRYEDTCRLAGSAFGHDASTVAMIGGDIDPGLGFDMLRDLVRGLPARQEPCPAEPVARASHADVWLMDNAKTDQAFFGMTRPGIRAGDPDRVALRVANHAMGGGGFSSLLMERVRAEMGHTYGISSYCPESRLATPFSVSSFTRAENLGRMLTLIDDVLAGIRDNGLTEDHCAAARDHLYGALPLRLTNPWQILCFVEDALRSGLTLEDLESDWHALSDVSLDAVNAAARRLIGDGQFRLAVVGPAKTLLPHLQGRGTVEVFPFRQPPERWPTP